MDELVKSVDALSREQLAALVGRLGLEGVRLPVLLPGGDGVGLQGPGTGGRRHCVDNSQSMALACTSALQHAPWFPERAAQQHMLLVLPHALTRAITRAPVGLAVSRAMAGQPEWLCLRHTNNI